MKRLAVLLLAVCVTASRGEPPVPVRPFTIPWGERGGSVKLEIGPPETGRTRAGPASIKVGPDGDVFVVNTLGGSIERFAPDGSLRKSYLHPRYTSRDVELSCIDVAFSPRGEVLALELATQSVLVFDAQGRLGRKVAVPRKPDVPSILTALECDAQGRLIVLDGYDNRLIRFGLDGKLVDRSTHPLATVLAIDSASRFVSVAFATPDSSARLVIWRFDPFGKAQEKLGEIPLAEPAVELSLLGVDRAGRIYVEVAFGTVETPRGRHALVVEKGAVTAKIALPVPPAKIGMTRSRAVAPAGGLVVARATKGGLVIEHLPLPEKGR